MILIDALHINSSGGKILLDYLIDNLEKTNLPVFYLLDKRVEGNTPTIKKQNKVVYMQASLSTRKQFYKSHKNHFKKVLCFGNLAPSSRTTAQVYTYFHQQLYIQLPSDSSVKLKFSFFLKKIIFRSLIKNTDYWMVQTDLINSNFGKAFDVNKDKVLTMPFYPELKSTENFETKKHTYLYVSNGSAHKNHMRLINAFCSFFDEYKKGELILTVGEENTELLSLLQEKKEKKYPITNLGFIPRQQLAKVYQESEYMIYPSLAESFGLGLVEAIENGCKILAADLPYTHAVCEPSLLFDPLDEKSIFQTLSLSLQQTTKPSVSKVYNKIDELISLLA